ncbi:hypothetical protein [Streptomyces sp. HUCO-GS316]|uniref:hypothetical protein n=1 Tax=Streptomyces sp. HUCO-GS316 TaxID=2692198 RepID=UPI0019291129|nr:hypothetical protein [Streptomyces sp. HUCO-GS316]
MTHGAHPNAPTPVPHVNLARARNCEHCRGWGSVVNSGRFELCPVCQDSAQPQ